MKEITSMGGIAMNAEANGLKKEIGLLFALSLVIGTIIGSGVFMKPGSVLSYSGNAQIALFAWLLGGILTLAGGLTIAELGAQIPKTGGLYTYLEEIYGEFWGFLCGWVQIIIYGPAIIGALGLYFGSLVANLFSWDKSWTALIGIITVACLGTISGSSVLRLFMHRQHRRNKIRRSGSDDHNDRKADSHCMYHCVRSMAGR